MSRFHFIVKDYRILKDAEVVPEGITLLWGKNGHGKSSLIKSLVSLLSNRHSEDNFRHGVDSYLISARAGDNSITYRRSGNTSTIRFNDEPIRSKIGQGTLFQIEPRFTLKRFDLEDTAFYPNIIFQNETLFDRIDPSQLFSVMFSDVAKISERVTQLKKDITSTSKLRNDAQANSDMLKEKVSASKKSVDKIKLENPNIEETYTYLKGLSVKRDNQAKFLAEYAIVSSSCSDPIKRNLVSLYQEAQPLFSDFVFVRNMQGVLSQAEKTQSELQTVQGLHNEIKAVFPVDVYPLVSAVRQFNTVQESLSVIRVDKDSIPDVSFGLISSGVTLVSLKKTLEGLDIELSDLPVVSDSLFSEVRDLHRLSSELAQVRSDLVDMEDSYNDVVNELKAVPCDRLINNLCPFQEQIKL